MPKTIENLGKVSLQVRPIVAQFWLMTKKEHSKFLRTGRGFLCNVATAVWNQIFNKGSKINGEILVSSFDA